MNREPIYKAMFDEVCDALKDFSFVTTERRLRHWDNVDPGMQPYLAMTQVREICSQQLDGVTRKWELQVQFYIYVQTNEEVPGPFLNPLLDAVCNRLKQDDVNTNACTLGGLVTSAYVDGTIETSEGLLGSQEVAIIPASIIVFDYPGDIE